MQNFITSVREWIRFELSDAVQILLIGIFTILALITFTKIVKALGNSKISFWKKFFMLVLFIVLGGLAIFIATA